MDFIFYFILLAILFRVVGHIFKSAGVKPSGDTSEESSYETIDPLYDILDNLNDFSEDEIVESAVDFYLFSLDRDGKQFVFILKDGTVYRYKFEKLVSYSVRIQENKSIAIDLKVRDINRPYLYISCFDTLKLYNEQPRQFSNAEELVNLYKEELENIDDIKVLLDEILEGNEQIPVSTPISQPKIEPKVVALPEAKAQPVEKAIEVVEVVKKEIEKKEEEQIKPEEVIDTPLVVEPFVVEKEEPTPLYVPEYTYKPLQEESVREEPPTVSVEAERDEDGKIKTALEEVDILSRGKFLESEVQSAVSDAKMKGKKFVYLTEEQLEKLKN